jgi:hypothetical protein
MPFPGAHSCNDPIYRIVIVAIRCADRPAVVLRGHQPEGRPHRPLSLCHGRPGRPIANRMPNDTLNAPSVHRARSIATKAMVLYYLESHDLKQVESDDFTLRRQKNSQDSVIVSNPLPQQWRPMRTRARRQTRRLAQRSRRSSRMRMR